MKRLFVILMLIVAGNSYASNWWPSGKSPENYNYYIDLESVTKNPKYDYGRFGWLKVVKSPNEFSLVKLEIYCPTRLMRIAEEHTYFNNNVIGSTVNTYPDYFSVTPDSFNERWMKVICSAKLN